MLHLYAAWQKDQQVIYYYPYQVLTRISLCILLILLYPWSHVNISLETFQNVLVTFTAFYFCMVEVVNVSSHNRIPMQYKYNK